jgi:hypothetical protein
MVNISKQHAGTSHEIKNLGQVFAKCKGSKEKNLRESPYVLKQTVANLAIAVRRTPLNQTLLCPSCTRTKAKRADQSAPARNWATQKLDETYLFWAARDGAERITATGIMMNIIKQHAGTSHGRNKWGH